MQWSPLDCLTLCATASYIVEIKEISKNIKIQCQAKIRANKIALSSIYASKFEHSPWIIEQIAMNHK